MLMRAAPCLRDTVLTRSSGSAPYRQCSGESPWIDADDAVHAGGLASLAVSPRLHRRIVATSTGSFHLRTDSLRPGE
jgi:hypothetical protein